MKHNRFWLLVPVLLTSGLLPLSLLLSGCSPKTPTATAGEAMAEVASAPSQGQQLFMTHCASCHQGMGSTPGPNATILKSSKLATEASFKALLRQPVSPMMPAFDPNTLNDEAVKVLYQYLNGEQKKHKTAQG